MLKLGAAIQNIVSKGITNIVCSDPAYVSDFSVNADQWIGDTGIDIILGNRDNIGRLDDNLGVRFTSGTPSISRALDENVSAGCTYSYSISVFIVGTNDEVTHISKLLVGKDEVIISTSPITPDTWITFTGTVAVSSTESSIGIEFNSDSTTGTADMVYLREISLSL